MPPFRVTAYTATSAAGTGNAALLAALRAGASGLVHLRESGDLPHCLLDTYVGRVTGLHTALPASYAGWDCRNNRLAWLALQQDGFLAQAQTLVQQYGASRVALVLGTSTSSMASTEDAFRARRTTGDFPPECRTPAIHQPNSLVGFVVECLGITGPQLTVATACSSSARVFGSAVRLMELGLADAAIVGGVDSLCMSVMYGFHALELMSATPCKPFDQTRNGLNIGEAGGFAILERGVDRKEGDRKQGDRKQGDRKQGNRKEGSLILAGYGESSDAHHMSTPHPEGLGAQQAMRAALSRAALTPEQIQYINLHGTATRINDEVEGRAITNVFNAPVPISSTKGITGHTLGAAGIVEAVVSLLALQHQLLPGSVNCDSPEPAMQGWLQRQSCAAQLDYVMSNSFGFGGNNCALVFARGEVH